STRNRAQHDDSDCERGCGQRDADPPRAVRSADAARHQNDRRLHRAQDGVGRGEAQGPGVSGRLRMPSVVWYFDQESWSAAMSSSRNRGDALIRATTAPGTSPSSTSCSIRANVSVNSYRETLMFAKFAYAPAMSAGSRWMLSRRSPASTSGAFSSSTPQY